MFKTRKVNIKGNVLMLMGPIGFYFSRLSSFIEKNGFSVYKISFPLFEYGFHSKRRIYYKDSLDSFRNFLHNTIIKYDISHVFMYGDFIIPHSIAISLVKELRITRDLDISTGIFELGYLRPNFITYESHGVNYNSSLFKESSFYHSLSIPVNYTFPTSNRNFRLWKYFKPFVFIQHAFTNYRITNLPHKLQPKPIYLYYQLLGFYRKILYIFTEKSIKLSLFNGIPYFFVVLQVSTDSQIYNGSKFSSIYEFIDLVIKSFASYNRHDARLVFKHHPRDRGYIDYKDYIFMKAKEFDIVNRVVYFHDSKISNLLTNSNCLGVVLINSSIGYQALFHKKHLIALGKAPYNIEGLTFQGHIDEFWNNLCIPDRNLFLKFYFYVLEQTQIPGNFDGDFDFKDSINFS